LIPHLARCPEEDIDKWYWQTNSKTIKEAQYFDQRIDHIAEGRTGRLFIKHKI
jgi:hypothetical protein